MTARPLTPDEFAEAVALLARENGYVLRELRFTSQSPAAGFGWHEYEWPRMDAVGGFPRAED